MHMLYSISELQRLQLSKVVEFLITLDMYDFLYYTLYKLLKLIFNCTWYWYFIVLHKKWMSILSIEENIFLILWINWDCVSTSKYILVDKSLYALKVPFFVHIQVLTSNLIPCIFIHTLIEEATHFWSDQMVPYISASTKKTIQKDSQNRLFSNLPTPLLHYDIP